MNEGVTPVFQACSQSLMHHPNSCAAASASTKIHDVIQNLPKTSKQKKPKKLLFGGQSIYVYKYLRIHSGITFDTFWHHRIHSGITVYILASPNTFRHHQINHIKSMELVSVALRFVCYFPQITPFSY
jgi:hypothetical protein